MMATLIGPLVRARPVLAGRAARRGAPRSVSNNSCSGRPRVALTASMKRRLGAFSPDFTWERYVSLKRYPRSRSCSSSQRCLWPRSARMSKSFVFTTAPRLSGEDNLTYNLVYGRPHASSRPGWYCYWLLFGGFLFSPCGMNPAASTSAPKQRLPAPGRGFYPREWIPYQLLNQLDVPL